MKISEEEWRIVEERLNSMPNEMNLGILTKSYNKEELILEVRNRTDVGEAYAEMQLEFVKWLIKQAKLITQENQN